MQNPFKQSEREPDPREGIGAADDTRGAPRGGQSWREGEGETGDGQGKEGEKTLVLMAEARE